MTHSVPLVVVRTQDFTPRLRRIVLGGAALAAFPAHSDGARVELCLPVADSVVTRPYSVAHHDAAAGELAIDVILRDDAGPASAWARHVLPGARVDVIPPASCVAPQPAANWYLYAGDLTGLAALTAAMRTLPRTARGVALIEIADVNDRFVLDRPAGIAVRWLLRRAEFGAAASPLLLDSIRALDWPSPPAVVLASEASQVAAVSDYLLRQRGLPPDHLRAEACWHEGAAYVAERI
jgi:NADPH-dependent ferric siderophore reductase